ncbi:hypothetical protein RFI_24330 [Reticulomyxa filosa]|uniref:Uncharacterized protein n=1 Tax=Reticulomyxa filosa TaxID=46433 RepID=X6MHA2_RETFI|nr:hypothetical protein RFI_24330 [Reticulomyxa filosa]|eukprot:ETO13046.1 hypothetical protein RFI_24330 [Reticulomyxa filosa]
MSASTLQTRQRRRGVDRTANEERKKEEPKESASIVENKKTQRKTLARGWNQMQVTMGTVMKATKKKKKMTKTKCKQKKNLKEGDIKYLKKLNPDLYFKIKKTDPWRVGWVADIEDNNVCIRYAEKERGKYEEVWIGKNSGKIEIFSRSEHKVRIKTYQIVVGAVYKLYVFTVAMGPFFCLGFLNLFNCLFIRHKLTFPLAMITSNLFTKIKNPKMMYIVVFAQQRKYFILLLFLHKNLIKNEKCFENKKCDKHKMKTVYIK